MNPGYSAWPFVSRRAISIRTISSTRRSISIWSPRVIRLQIGAEGLAQLDVLRRADLLVTARCLTAAFGSATVVLIYAVGKRVVDAAAGLVAAALLAFAFLHVRDSHFGTTDVPMTCGIVLGFFTLLRSGEGGGGSATAGLAVGLATAIKYNAILLTPVALYSRRIARSGPAGPAGVGAAAACSSRSAWWRDS